MSRIIAALCVVLGVGSCADGSGSVTQELISEFSPAMESAALPEEGSAFIAKKDKEESDSDEEPDESDSDSDESDSDEKPEPEPEPEPIYTGKCDVYSQEQCSGDADCYYANAGNAGFCAASTGDKTQGQPCTVQTECSAGYVCRNWECRLSCFSHNDCHDDTTCNQTGDMPLCYVQEC